jgi:hypothetical protein
LAHDTATSTCHWRSPDRSYPDRQRDPTIGSQHPRPVTLGLQHVAQSWFVGRGRVATGVGRIARGQLLGDGEAFDRRAALPARPDVASASPIFWWLIEGRVDDTLTSTHPNRSVVPLLSPSWAPAKSASCCLTPPAEVTEAVSPVAQNVWTRQRRVEPHASRRISLWDDPKHQWPPCKHPRPRSASPEPSRRIVIEYQFRFPIVILAVSY